jgi:hypothetical protein
VVDLQRAYATVIREALWLKLEKSASSKFTEGLKDMYKDIRIAEK